MNTATVVRDGHRLFRAALLALAYPGVPMPVPVSDGWEVAGALVEATWPDTASVWSADPTRSPLGRPIAEVPDADVLLVLGSTSHGRLLDARRGTEEWPEDGATAVYVVDPSAAPQTRTQLFGPGVNGAVAATLPLTAKELADRAACCVHRPLGVDLLMINGDTVVGLPRTTQVEVLG